MNDWSQRNGWRTRGMEWMDVRQKKEAISALHAVRQAYHVIIINNEQHVSHLISLGIHCC
jgi:hypothetical protein